MVTPSTIVTIAGMIAFSGPAATSVMSRSVIYEGGLAFAVRTVADQAAVGGRWWR